jgi:hypothetical protein
LITESDLQWWLRVAATLEWIWARTYAESAPHSYVVLGRTSGLTQEEFVRAGRVIHTFGRPAKFYGMTSIYLTSPDGRVKWWTMDDDVTQTSLVNQAPNDRLYGVQNAPSTDSGQTTPYDGIATEFDQLHPTSEALAKSLRAAVAQLKGDYPPAILDVGCGTGRVLDLALTAPDRYAGVDPSTPMLNQLVRKHPNVGAIYPMRVEEALVRELFTPGQFEVVTVLGDNDMLDPDITAALSSIASRGLIVSQGDHVKLLLSASRS